MNIMSNDSPSEIDELLQELAETKNTLRMFSAVIENFPGGIILTDQDLNVVVCNDQQKQLLDYSPVLFSNRTPTLLELFHFNAIRGEYGPGRPEALVAEKMELVQKRIPHRFERVRPDGRVVEVRGVPIRGGGFVTSYVDVTERRRTEDLVLKLAFADSLTGLCNRAALSRDFSSFAARATRGEHYAIHYIDLDDFKPVNDTFGHKVGDALLIEVAKRISAAVRDTDIAARFGGDEFVVLQSDVSSPQNIKTLSARLVDLLKKPFLVENNQLHISGSIGAVCSASNGNYANLDAMIGAADIEMYKSKSLGKGNYHVHGCAMNGRCCQIETCSCKNQKN
jgi:diguanylate cyclase (GGDEF)-like protein